MAGKKQKATTDISESFERVLNGAERLFSKKGYNAVTLRDIAEEIGIRHASLYHHIPGGKEELFIKVTERSLQRHRIGLTQAIEKAKPDIRSKLCAVADWLLSQPPMDLIRMAYSDLPSINPKQAFRLSEMGFESLLMPIERALAQGKQQGEIEYLPGGPTSGAILGMIESLFAIPEFALEKSRQKMAYDVIDTLLMGLVPRQGKARRR